MVSSLLVVDEIEETALSQDLKALPLPSKSMEISDLVQKIDLLNEEGIQLTMPSPPQTIDRRHDAGSVASPRF